MNTLYKPNGKEVQVNDNSLAHALSIGWTSEDPTEVVEVEEVVAEEVIEVVEVEVEKKEPTKKKANKKAD